jgi:broad specificity polyphosphatase/5'/3'-nucleotidase SurE
LGQEGTDFDAISKNKVSITPLDTDFTNFKSMEEFKDWL